MDQKITTVILVNPSISLFPLSSWEYPDFNLPIVNEPILSLNLRWVSPISSKIIIVCIEDHSKMIKKAIKHSGIQNKIETHIVKSYEGSFQTVSLLKNMIETETILIFKGDFYSKIKAHTLCDYFYESNAEVLSFFYRSTKDKFSLCSYKDNNLFFYTEENEDVFRIKTDFFEEHDEVLFNKDYKLLQIYMLNKNALSFKPTGLSFKNEIFPAMIDFYRINRPIKMMIFEKEDMFQINSIEKFDLANKLVKISNTYPEWTDKISKACLHTLFEYKCKNKKRVMFKDQNDTRKSVVSLNLQKYDNVVIYNSIIGNNVKLGDNVKIGSSIIMDNVIIGNNCIIEKCIIGYGSTVADNSVLNSCLFACDYHLPASVKSKDKNFYKIDF